MARARAAGAVSDASILRRPRFRPGGHFREPTGFVLQVALELLDVEFGQECEERDYPGAERREQVRHEFLDVPGQHQFARDTYPTAGREPNPLGDQCHLGQLAVEVVGRLRRVLPHHLAPSPPLTDGYHNRVLGRAAANYLSACLEEADAGSWAICGERGIRTPDTLTGTPDFESESAVFAHC